MCVGGWWREEWALRMDCGCSCNGLHKMVFDEFQCMYYIIYYIYIISLYLLLYTYVCIRRNGVRIRGVARVKVDVKRIVIVTAFCTALQFCSLLCARLLVFRVCSTFALGNVACGPQQQQQHPVDAQLMFTLISAGSRAKLISFWNCFQRSASAVTTSSQISFAFCDCHSICSHHFVISLWLKCENMPHSKATSFACKEEVR